MDVMLNGLIATDLKNTLISNHFIDMRGMQVPYFCEFPFRINLNSAMMPVCFKFKPWEEVLTSRFEAFRLFF